jgi:hypothetical protein
MDFRRHKELTVFLMFNRDIRFDRIDLLICLPITTVCTSIGTDHFPESFSNIVDIMTFIYTTIGPHKYSISLFLITHPLTLILITPSWTLLPYPLPISQPILKISFEKTAGRPIILPIT